MKAKKNEPSLYLLCKKYKVNLLLKLFNSGLLQISCFFQWILPRAFRLTYYVLVL